ncbi:hypothetical protein A3C87_03560 [Candidatus Kaiserbacteria bacterium RIFCSPHIGHO2_02_FULL_49_34]|uniref:Rhodanese domain-containing protein n=1 Tax=Candidatus Kaiserbacteria bacterium RIFCSPHIGHO2_02_FULL_49_34 TaxID=1798491 RepID=A0A1F6DIB8_9BACT|nr:MAG: hypothetical protein A3C87_03560 [Candidatus Kaiserbacteria bacterium RIFCSPHIGHO2_02_FULL_49_34]
MATHIEIEVLKKKLDSGEKIFLIDTLAAESYEMYHIKGAVSVPYGEDFIAQFEAKVGAPKDAEIITYCASHSCQLSSLAANALEAAGYTNVGHYADGLAEWRATGYPTEGERA